jgi:hypothetical protein
MAFDPKAEPCWTCGREPEDCICGLAPDIADDVDGLDLNEDFEDWGYTQEEDQDESIR